MNRIPQHIAIIMDGNGRWAKAKGGKRGEGHIAGASALHDTMMNAAKLGVKYVTVYAFSTENWTRPDEEVNGLMALLFEKLDISIFMDNDIRFYVIGECHHDESEVIRPAASENASGSACLCVHSVECGICPG